MLTLKLSTEEAEILLKILEYHISELRMEIADTDRGNFRDDLHKRENVINKILSMLSQPEGESA